ncbi:MAG: gamma-glutamyltranspeptidase / glutathione hydrolase [Thermomicrobiales bacterium]|nr:gamma-glutamyltranspeptidase / glutathione hydrolase [Thermomicrobiales bacterium]
MSFPYAGVQRRPAVTGRKGMVSSAHPLASLAGLRTLMEGGNAIDAAVAVASCLGATEIGLSGIGGVGWMQIYHAKTKTHTCLDYQGWSPYAAERSVFEGPEQLLRGLLSPMVPGSPAGWCAALERFGTMDRGNVFKHVIEICEEGHPLTVHAAGIIKTYEPWLREHPSSEAFFFGDGQTLRAGHLFKQPDLARTFRALVEGGPDVYYKGDIADKIVDFCQSNGGLLTKQDLADLTVEWVDPIDIRYRDFTVTGPPPPSSAMQWLQTLKLLEGFDVAGMGHSSVDHLHTLLEVERLAIADRVHYNVRPGAPIAALLSDEYCAERRRLVNPERASRIVGARYARTMEVGVVKPGDLGHRESTTHFNVVDDEGNAVSCTQSLGGFGCGVVVPETGILLNDFLYWFDLDADSPNVVAPHKKVEMCLSPGMIWRDGKVFACMGTPGSHGIMETTPQFMSNLMDFGMTIQAAIEAPRVRPMEGNKVIAEGRIAADVVAGLNARGHLVEMQPDFSMAFGGAQGIMVDPDNGTFSGGADPRRDGYAIGW